MQNFDLPLHLLLDSGRLHLVGVGQVVGGVQTNGAVELGVYYIGDRLLGRLWGLGERPRRPVVAATNV